MDLSKEVKGRLLSLNKGEQLTLDEINSSELFKLQAPAKEDEDKEGSIIVWAGQLSQYKR